MNHSGLSNTQGYTSNRAKKDADGKCITYSETLYEHFVRIGSYFEKTHANYRIDAEHDLPLD